MVNVLAEYIRMSGVEPGETREETVAKIKAALEAADDFDAMDEELLAMDELEDDTLPARWLKNDRKPLLASYSFTVSVQSSIHYLANLTRETGGSLPVFTETLEKEGSYAAVLALRDGGYSFNEVMECARQLHFKISVDMFGHEGVPNHMVPRIRISKQPRSVRLSKWEFLKFWLKEPNDLSLGEPILWELPPERIEELGLPYMPVQIIEDPSVSGEELVYIDDAVVTSTETPPTEPE